MTKRGPGEVLFAFVRHWSRRSWAEKTAEQGRLVLVTQAVDALARGGVGASVNEVGHEIGIDQSGASRLLKTATDAGYLTMGTTPTDGRRRQATVTTSGHEMLSEAHAWQEAMFAQLTEGWSVRQSRDFQQAMTELIERSYRLDS